MKLLYDWLDDEEFYELRLNGQSNKLCKPKWLYGKLIPKRKISQRWVYFDGRGYDPYLMLYPLDKLVFKPLRLKK